MASLNPPNLPTDAAAAVPPTEGGLIRNTLVASATQMLSLVIGFIITPILIDALGPSQFGIYAILASLTAYFGVLDFGIGAGLVRNLAFHSARNDTTAVRQVMTFGLLFYIGFGAVLTPLTFAAAPFLVGAMRLPAAQAETATSLVVIMSVYFIASSMSGVMTSRLTSLHRLDVASYCNLSGQIVSALILVIFVRHWPNIYFVIAATGLQVGVAFTLATIAVLRLAPEMLCSPTRISRDILRSLFGFGAWSQICSICAVANLEAGKLVIGRYLGMAAVTPYQVGSRVAMLNRILPLTLLGALLPGTTNAVSLGLPAAEMERRYGRNLRYLMLSTMLITGFIVAVADLFIRAWIGRSIPQAGLIAVALALSCAINNMTGIGTVFVKARGQPRYEAYYGVVSTGLNILFTVLLTPRFGIYGVAGGTIIGNVLGSCFFIILFHTVSGYSWWRTTGAWLVRLLSACVVAVTLTRLFLQIVPADWTANRLTDVAALAASGAIYVVALAAALSFFGFWDEDDHTTWRRTLARLPSWLRVGAMKSEPVQGS